MILAKQHLGLQEQCDRGGKKYDANEEKNEGDADTAGSDGDRRKGKGLKYRITTDDKCVAVKE